jgi:regulation of enolase protein 1 (concanavalin A-like superfamily)
LGFANASDGFRFIYRRVLGDTKLQARVVAFQGKPNRQAGIALRGSLDAGAAEVALVADEAGVLLLVRTAAGQTVSKTRVATTLVPVYLQLDRRGSLVTVTYSTDGTAWKAITTLSVAFPSDLFAGLAVAGGPNDGLAAAAFDRLSLVSVSANAAPVVSLTSPATAQIVTQGQVVTMSATASDPDDLVARVEFLVNGATVATDTAAPYSASWTAGTPGSYTLIAKASDYEGAVTSTPPVTVTVVSTTSSPPSGDPTSGSPATTLPQGWASADVGAAPTAGTASYSNGSFLATSAGLGFGNASDGFRFIYQRVVGDAKLQARVVSSQGKPNRQAGIVLRASLDGGAVDVALVADEAGLLLLGRTAAGQTAWKERVVTTLVPVYLQLDRRGSMVTVTYSTDGTVWKPITTLSVAFPSELFVGLAVAGGPNNGPATATFDRVSFVSASTSSPPSGDPSPTTPSGPWRLTFSASLDDATLHHYQLDLYNHLSGVQVVTRDLGKPAKAADGSISVDVNTVVTALPLGSYDAVVRSVLPSGASSPSPPYNFNR